jgi:hypothetical protein
VGCPSEKGRRMTLRKFKHIQVYARDGERYDYVEDAETDYHVEFHKEEDVLVVTEMDFGNKGPAKKEMVYFQPVRYYVELLDD